jgi:type IX secretion system PorP/SprF family membrane protein
MKRILTSMILSAVALLSYGQQQEHYSMYMQNNFLVNPAEGGTDEFIDLKVGYRTQWVDFGNTGEGGPKTVFISGHTPLNKHETKLEGANQKAFHGVGGSIISDGIGPFNIVTAKAAYAYHLPISHGSNPLILSLGAFGGIKQFQVQGTELSFSSDQTATDPFAHSFKTVVVPDFSLGIWGYSKSYYFGIASFQLLNSKIDVYNEIDEALTNASAGGALAMHHWFTAGYKVHIDTNWYVVPSIVAKYVQGAPMTFDFNAKIRYQDLYWAGVSYRREDAVVILAGVTVKKLVDIGYSYDVTRTDIKTYSSGSHEIILGMRLPNHQHHPPPAQFW